MPRDRVIRRRVFVGCQGESERSYATLLHRLVERSHRLHIDAVPLYPGAGDPLATVERALHMLRRREAQFGRYRDRAVLLDFDQVGLDHARDSECVALARRRGFRLIWQRPCHEGLLLRHIPECCSHFPTTAAAAIARLRRCWPEYEKAMSANLLERRIGVQAVIDVCRTEKELCEFLTQIGFLPASKG